MDVFAGIIVLLVAAKILGELIEYAGYPSLIGEIVAWIILGPSILYIVEITRDTGERSIFECPGSM